MTLDEKISMLAGADLWHSVAVPRLGIPQFKVTDGPNGVRGAWGSMGPTSVCTPVGIALGATWNTVGQSAVVTDRINSEMSTTEGRTDGWDAALDLWSRRPLFGYGLGNYTTVAEKEGVDDTALENEHLRILFGAGLLGFVPYVGWLVFILRDSIRLYRRSKQNGVGKSIVDPHLVVTFWGVFLGFFINYLATVANVYSVTMVFYLLVGALVGSQARFLTPTPHTDEKVHHQMSTTG